MNIVLIGDDYKNSDIGLFCKRVENFRSENSELAKIYYCNSVSGDDSIGTVSAENIRIIVNIGNNVYFLANFQKLILFISRNYTAPISCIVHDVSLEYPAELIARSIIENRAHPNFNLKALDLETIRLVFEWLIPDHLRASFITADYHMRGNLLLLYVLDKCRNAVCHSEYALKALSLITYGCRLPVQIEKINLAYDVPPVIVGPFKNSYYRGKKKINILLFSFAFNASKNMDLLCNTIKSLASTHSVILGVTGKTSTPKVRELVSHLEGLNNVDINLHGFVRTEYLCKLIGDASYVWCFRAPTHGETSGTVLRALSFGACPIVSDLGWYSELPEDLVLRVSEHMGAKALAKKILGQLDYVDNIRQDRVDYVMQRHSPTYYAETISRVVCIDNLLDQSIVQESAALGVVSHDTRINTNLIVAIIRNRNLQISTPLMPSWHLLSSLDGLFDIHAPAPDKSPEWIDYIATSLMPSKSILPKNICAASISPISYINEEIQIWYPYSTRLELFYHLMKDSLYGRIEIDLQGVQPISFSLQSNLFTSAGFQAPSFELSLIITALNNIFYDIANYHEGEIKVNLLDTTFALIVFEVLAFFRLRRSVAKDNGFDESWYEFADPIYSFLLGQTSSFSDQFGVREIYVSNLRRSFTLGNTLAKMPLNN